MTERTDPFDGEMSLRDIASLKKQKPAASKPPAEQPAADTPAPAAPIKQKANTTMLGDPADQVVVNPPETRQFNESAGSEHAVFAFGRFNPPTVGHEKLIHATEKVAKDVGGSAHIIASHSQNTFKDPLPQNKKIGYLKKVVSKGTEVSGSSKDEPSLLHAAKRLHATGVQHLHMVAGSDRAPEYERLLNKYNGTHEGALYNFKSITIHSAGQRDPDAEGVEGMSGTKMRAAAREGDSETFKSGLPKALHPHAEEISDHVRNIKEDVESEEMLIERVVSITTRMHRAVAMRKNKARLERAREIARRRLAKQGSLNRRAMKRAKGILRTRLAGSAGTGYAGLTVSQKIAIDKMVERKKGAIKNIARKIAPRIKGDEMRRLQAVTTGKKYSNSRVVVASYDMIGNMISEKEHKAIVEKAQASGIPTATLLQVFTRGKSAFKNANPPGKTPSQYGFDRLNSFINGGKAVKEDSDLVEQKKPTLRDVLAKGMHTARNMETLDAKHIKPVQTAAAHAANIKDTNDDSEMEMKKKRANIIRRKTQEYVHKVVEERGIRDTTSPSLAESIAALTKKVK